MGAYAALSVPGAAKDADKTYNVVLDNSFVGNTFRVLMEKEVVAATDYAPLKGRVKLRIINTDGSVSGQIASLNQIIQDPTRRHPARRRVHYRLGSSGGPGLRRRHQGRVVR